MVKFFTDLKNKNVKVIKKIAKKEIPRMLFETRRPTNHKTPGQSFEVNIVVENQSPLKLENHTHR